MSVYVTIGWPGSLVARVSVSVYKVAGLLRTGGEHLIGTPIAGTPVARDEIGKPAGIENHDPT